MALTQIAKSVCFLHKRQHRNKKTSPEVTIKELFANYDKAFHTEEEIDFGREAGEEKFLHLK